MSLNPESQGQLLGLAVKDLQDLLAARSVNPEPPDQLADVDGYAQLYATLLEVRTSIMAFASGDLGFQISKKGYLPGAIKALQAALSHLTWQTKMIASGDFTQRVDFMGEFSESFNSMVRQLDETMHQLEKASRTDPLTGINNRGYFMQLLKAEIERARRHERYFSVLMFDLDHFKKINDTFGHAAGDAALQSFVSILQNSGLRECDFWGRLGGEEFAVALPETTLQRALIPAERIRSLLEEKRVTHEDATFVVTASIGISQYVLGDTGETVLIRADQAMYRAKQEGRNRVCSEAKGDSAC
jgi:diguanylate cyclase (GGDEF)-like protein